MMGNNYFAWIMSLKSHDTSIKYSILYRDEEIKA